MRFTCGEDVAEPARRGADSAPLRSTNRQCVANGDDIVQATSLLGIPRWLIELSGRISRKRSTIES